MNVEDLMVGDWVLLYENDKLTPVQVTLDLMCNRAKDLFPIRIDSNIMLHNGFTEDEDSYTYLISYPVFTEGIRIYKKERLSLMAPCLPILRVHQLQHLLKFSAYLYNKKIIMPPDYSLTVEQYKQQPDSYYYQ